MSKLLSSPAIAGAILTLSCLGATPALATSLVTFVSGKGTDTGTCASPASPCRSFHLAINQTSAGGEIKALDPADYDPTTITKSISITGSKAPASTAPPRAKMLLPSARGQRTSSISVT